jgi:hypothetical protein
MADFGNAITNSMTTRGSDFELTVPTDLRIGSPCTLQKANDGECVVHMVLPSLGTESINEVVWCSLGEEQY